MKMVISRSDLLYTKEKGVKWKVSGGDLIVLIEFVCVEVGRGARELGGSQLGEQPSSIAY